MYLPKQVDGLMVDEGSGLWQSGYINVPAELVKVAASLLPSSNVKNDITVLGGAPAGLFEGKDVGFSALGQDGVGLDE